MKDLVFKAVGVGSVGTFCCVGLFLTGDTEAAFLQLKQAQCSVLERLGSKLKYKGHQGRRVVEGDKMISRQRYLSRLRRGRYHWAAFLSSNIEELQARQHQRDRRTGSAFQLRSDLCGRTLSRAHARSGDPAAIAGYIGKSEQFDDAMASFAMLYADQQRDSDAALAARRRTER